MRPSEAVEDLDGDGSLEGQLFRRELRELGGEAIVVGVLHGVFAGDGRAPPSPNALPPPRADRLART